MDCALDSWERGCLEARKNYAGALEVILNGAKCQMRSMNADSEVDEAGGFAESARGRLEADCTVDDGDGSVAGSTAGGGKRMSVGSLLLKRVRYFTDGAVIGSKAFVERVFENNRGKFRDGRKHASRPWRDPGDSEKRAEFGLHSLKDLRVNVYEE